jgi:anthranilate synthase component 2
VQFHPESIASQHGHDILKNFLDIARGSNQPARAA